ncbi:MAG: FHA domain-containing protein [Lachnospiraceae bacterium]|nr:FHA domain-containing protein [Lachnospiraceae bacterium]
MKRIFIPLLLLFMMVNSAFFVFASEKGTDTLDKPGLKRPKEIVIEEDPSDKDSAGKESEAPDENKKPSVIPTKDPSNPDEDIREKEFEEEDQPDEAPTEEAPREAVPTEEAPEADPEASKEEESNGSEEGSLSSNEISKEESAALREAEANDKDGGVSSLLNSRNFIFIIFIMAIVILILIALIAILIRKGSVAAKAGRRKREPHTEPPLVEVIKRSPILKPEEGDIKISISMIEGRLVTKGNDYYMRKDLIIGCDPDQCEIGIEGKGVSSRHARISAREDGLYIEDLNSIGGTYIGGMRIYAINRIRSGDEIGIGDTGFTVFF